MEINPEVKAWLKDAGEVVVTLAAIIIVSKLLFGAHMLIPLVAVTSESMLHTSDAWSDWLVSENISGDVLAGFPMQGGFAKGDMIVTITPNGEGVIHPFFSDAALGDVVIYNRDRHHMPGAPPIIHRVVGVVHVAGGEVESVEGTLDCLSVEDFEETHIPGIESCNSGGRCNYFDYPKEEDYTFYVTKGDNNPQSDQCVGIAYPVTDAQLTARGWIVLPYIGWIKLILNAIIPI